MNIINPLKKFIRQSISPDPQITLLLKDEKHRVILDWSAKSGCTIAIKMFFKQMGILDEALRYNSWIHEFRDDQFYKRFGTVTQKDLKNPQYTVFKVVRNPYMRTVSAYLYLINEVAHKVPSIMQEVTASTGVTDITHLTFSQYIQFLQTIDLDTCNVHFRKQYKRYEASGICTPIICKLESIATDIDQLNQQHHLHFDLQGLSSNHHTEKNHHNTTFVGKTPWHQFQHEIPEYLYFYDEDSYATITKLYQDEIMRYQYSFPWKIPTKDNKTN